MSKLTRLTGLLCLLSLLVACGSTPQSNHYLLTANISETPAGQSPALGIGPVTIPEYLNRNSLVYSRGENQLHISSTERWAEPLEDGITRVLGLNLARLLNTENVRPFPWHPKRPPDYGIKVRIMSLDASDSEVSMVAEWLVFRTDNAEPLHRRISQLREPLPGGELAPQQIAPAYSALFYQLSEIIAAAIEESDPAAME